MSEWFARLMCKLGFHNLTTDVPHNPDYNGDWWICCKKSGWSWEFEHSVRRLKDGH